MTARKDHSLAVFRSQDLLGWLRLNAATDELSFQYASDWAARPDAFELSPAIRFDQAAAPVSVRRFIQNLLPEGQVLDTAASFNNVSKSNVFGLTHAMGAETAGALRFLPEGKAPSTHALRRLVRSGELAQRISNRDSQPFSVNRNWRWLSVTSSAWLM